MHRAAHIHPPGLLELAFLRMLDPYPRTTAEVAAAVRVGTASAELSLVGLEQRRFVEREADGWRLTSAGRTAVISAGPPARDAILDLLGL